MKCGFLTPIVELKRRSNKPDISFKVEKCDYEYGDKEDYVEHLRKKHKVVATR